MIPSFRLTIQTNIKYTILLFETGISPCAALFNSSERASCKAKEQSTRLIAFAKASGERSVDGHYQNDQTYQYTRLLAFTKASERVQCGRYFYHGGF